MDVKIRCSKFYCLKNIHYRTQPAQVVKIQPATSGSLDQLSEVKFICLSQITRYANFLIFQRRGNLKQKPSAYDVQAQSS